MNLNNTKILFTDLDGTLLNTQKQISEHAKATILTMLDAGHKLVLASGRPLYSILERKEQLGLPDHGVYVTAFNGALLYDCEAHKLLSEQRVPIDTAQALFDLAKKRKLHIQTYMNNTLVSIADDAELAYYTQFVPSEVIISSDVTTLLTEAPFKLLAIDLQEPLTKRLAAFRKEIQESELGTIVDSAFSHDTYLEFYNKNAGKGIGVINLCKLLSIPLENSIAAGDAENDLSMIEAAGVGVCMQNGTSFVKERADYITSYDNDHDGIVEIIEKFILP